MPNLYTITAKAENVESKLTPGEETSIFYHSLFDYPLNFSDLLRWTPHKSLWDSAGQEASIVHRSGFYFLEGKDGIVYKRMLRERISVKKMEIARRSAKLLSFVPSVKMVAVTGSLAMQNASDESDIDLMIVTKKGTLWMTRIFVYLLIGLFGIAKRSPNSKFQKDALCLNMWLDESDLNWRTNKNIYTAHEIAQIVPLVNKDQTYEKFMSSNKWILKFWPNAVRISSKQNVESSMRKQGPLLHTTYYILHFFEKIAFYFQYQHMSSKITREVITPTRALFHPQDWSEFVLSHFSS